MGKTLPQPKKGIRVLRPVGSSGVPTFGLGKRKNLVHWYGISLYYDRLSQNSDPLDAFYRTWKPVSDSFIAGQLSRRCQQTMARTDSQIAQNPKQG